MGYRFCDNPPKPEDMLNRFSVRNGATLRSAFSCFYFKPKPGHDPNFHDHVGWPSPDNPDNICQMMPPQYPPMKWRPAILRTPDDLEPIHLLDEGYQEAAITFDNPDIEQCLTYKAWIDEDDDFIVRIYITAELPTFEDKPKETRFTVFVKKTYTDPITNETMITKDTVCHGIFTILPGSPYLP